MTDQEINVAIAEACGWTELYENTLSARGNFWAGKSPTTGYGPIPSYTTSLDAMHEAEKVLSGDDRRTFIFRLYDVLGGAGTIPTFSADIFNYAHATARQRAEAFLRTVGKWKD